MCRPGSIAITLRERRFILAGEIETARRHAGRLEDALGDAVLESLAGHLLDHMTGNGVAGIRVRHASAGPPPHDARCRIDLQHVLERQLRRVRAGVDLVEVHVVEPGGVLQQMNHAHGIGGVPGVVDPDLRHNPGDGRVEIDFVIEVQLDER